MHTSNRLLSALPPEDYARLSQRLEFVRLPRGKVVYAAGDSITYVYFILNGILSLISVGEDGSMIEVGMVGKEGAVGIPIVLGVSRMPYQALTQIPAAALRIRADTFREEWKDGSPVSKLLLRYLYLRLTQLSVSAICNRYHTVEQRFCRWLLVARDRVDTDTLNFTQEFLSYMIGAPRTGVTATAGELQKADLIKYHRGAISILDRQGLEVAACHCYRSSRDELRRFLTDVGSREPWPSYP